MTNLTTNLGIAGLATVVMSSFAQTRAFLNRAFSFILCSAELQCSGSYDLLDYVLSAMKVKPNMRSFFLRDHYLWKEKLHKKIIFETVSNSMHVIFYNKIPMIVYLKNNDHITFRYIKGTVNIDKFLEEFGKYYNNKNNNKEISRFRIINYTGSYKEKQFSQGALKASNKDSEEVAPSSENILSSFPIGYQLEDLYEPVKNSEKDFLQNLALDNNTLKVIKEIEYWYNSKEFYEEREIAWRRGLLLYGPPGTGKSSLVLALAKKLNVPIFIFDLSTMNNKEFINYYDNCTSSTPCIILFEDFDNVFDKRKNLIDPKNGLTFDCILNCMSGVKSSSGTLLFITTNDISKIDEALGSPTNDIGSRPGRIDKCIELKELTKDGRYKIAKRILTECPEKIETIVNSTNNFTGAQFVEKCTTIALEHHWKIFHENH